MEFEQMDLFTDYQALEQEREEEKAARERERRIQEAMLDIKKKYGKNAILKGLSYQEGTTGKERNRLQIPLHRITDSASNGSVFPVVTEHFSASSDHAFL